LREVHVGQVELEKPGEAVMTPLVMVMGFADSMQMVSAIRIRLREGDTIVYLAEVSYRGDCIRLEMDLKP
jgi:hypothetical protein